MWAKLHHQQLRQPATGSQRKIALHTRAQIFQVIKCKRGHEMTLHASLQHSLAGAHS